MELQPEAVVAIFGLIGLYPVWKGGPTVADRKAIDLESQDIAIEAWLRAPDTPLPSARGGLPRIDFTGSKVELSKALQHPDAVWAKSIDHEDAARARIDLLYAWPKDGQPLDIQVYHLETALDAKFGLKGKTTIPPALSNQLRGDAESTDLEVLPRRRQVKVEGNKFGKPTVRPFRCSCGGSWNERSLPGAGISCSKQGCSRMVWAGASPAENDRINAELLAGREHEGVQRKVSALTEGLAPTRFPM